MLRALLGLASRHQMNLRLPAAPGYEARVIERPGQWMPAADLAALLDEMRQLAARATPGGSLSYGVLSGAPERLENAVLTLVRDSAGRLVAFNALALMDLRLGRRPVQVLHLGLVLIDPANRARGLSWVLYGLTCFLLLVRGGLRPIWVSNVTQVPAIVGMVAESFGQVFPAPVLGSRPPPRRSLTHLLLARQIMAGIAMSSASARGAVRRGPLRHRQCLYRRVRGAEEAAGRLRAAPRPGLPRLLRRRAGL